MENTDKTTISEAAKSHFRNSAMWMRAYAIIMIVMVSIIALFLIILSADSEGKVLQAMADSSTGNEIVDVLVETFGMIIFGLACFVVLFGYASIKLLGAANKFTALSYSTNREDLIKGFKNLRMYWMFYGITLIVMLVLGVYFMVKVFAVVSQASQS